ncbi:hypothetical protein Nos7524_0885 [Nostoc sp. PCC 7524]|uniref:hypothetical protein n=1 Tax=Nostoc sp. (strain ATCC 29411 / PCC 7524) TaxID=28072 RepID=UPI00029ED275|nr:hypothetical protein [Nostoc sp. PCC 7524]AFY46784.1 hypothetical protein Nos7524_0885 [Nostoc sp. PCC 7524]
MNLSWTHIHLILNHFPIVGAIFGLLLFIYAIFKNNQDLMQATYWVFVIIVLLAIPVFFSGTQAATVAHHLPNVSESIIHQHRAIAEQTLIVLGMLGVLCFIALLVFRVPRKAPTWFTILLLVLVIIATALVSWTGVRGGVIRHTEVRGELEFLAPINETKPQDNKASETETEHSH